MRYTNLIFCMIFSAVAYSGVPPESNDGEITCTISDQSITIRNSNTTIRINNGLQLEISLEKDGLTNLLTKQDNTPASVFLSAPDNKQIFFTRKTAQVNEINNKFGKGKMVIIEAVSPDNRITSRTSFGSYYRFPNVILIQSSFKNSSETNYHINDYTLDHLSLDPGMNQNKWWSFQGASYYWGQDFAFQLPQSFKRDNYMGLNDTRVGSGIPFIDVWNKEFGLALAYLGEKPRDLYFPVKAENGIVQIEIKENFKNQILKPNDSVVSAQTAIIAHRNDFYDPIRTYSMLMKPFLPEFKKPVAEAYKSEWCTWGYRRDFNPEDILGKLPHLKSIGVRSIILDDGWSPNHGDWIPDPVKFPGGDEDFKKLINKIHQKGLKVWVWWLPGYADSMSQLAVQHRGWLVKNKDGSIHRSYALCPAYEPVQEHYKKLVEKFVRDYKLDGLKLDFQEINSAPPCYDPAHRHKDPLESYHSTPTLFKNIYQAAVRYNPGMLIEYCSCGIPPSIFHLPWINLAVTSDPGIQQITQRIKMYKALMGDDFPVLEEYCGVLAGPLYALTIGTGGVPGTFSTLLDKLHEKWLKVYEEKQLSKGGKYLNLYDIGFDYPETHVIKKGPKFYYAFYTHPWKQPEPTSRVYRYGTEFDYKLEGKKEYNYPVENFSGPLDLRGLDKSKRYRIVDYPNNKELGSIQGNKPYLNVSFDDYLLLEVSPID